MIWEIWESQQEHCFSLCLKGFNHNLEPDAVLLHSFFASTYNEAKEFQHDYLGWEPYKPIEETT